LVEEYCWVLTQVTGWTCYSWSCSSVFQFRFKLDCHVHTNAVNNICTQFRLMQNSSYARYSRM